MLYGRNSGKRTKLIGAGVVSIVQEVSREVMESYVQVVGGLKLTKLGSADIQNVVSVVPLRLGRY